MPGTLVQTSATGGCAHGGQIIVAGTGARVTLSGLPVALAHDTHPVAGCPLNVSGAPSPCVTASQFIPATRVLVQGQPPILNTSIGLGKNAAQAPQGPATITSAQVRVTAI